MLTLSDDPDRNTGLLPQAPIDVALVRAWIERVPTLTFHGKPQPKPQQVASFLGRFWLPDESIVYIGKAGCLRTRLGAFFRHRLGERSPHAGGHWVKTLSCLAELHIFFCECRKDEEPEDKESEALRAFAEQVSETTKRVLCNPKVPIPFGNRELPMRKQTAIKHDAPPSAP